MKKRAYLVALGLLLSVPPLWAKDSVSIKFMPGYPPPGVSSEYVVVEVSRTGSTDDKPTEVDNYFAEVTKILKAGKVPPQWGLVQIDGPSVQVNISLDGRSYRLEVTYGEKGVDLSGITLDADKRNAKAIQAILQLTAKRANAYFVGK